jgi:hypothetical protein
MQALVHFSRLESLETVFLERIQELWESQFKDASPCSFFAPRIAGNCFP